MRLKKLIKNLPLQMVKGSKEIEITGISSNSRAIGPGNLFIAKRGSIYDGARYIPDAIAAGAVAVLTDMYNPFHPQVVQLIHPDVATIEVELVKRFYPIKEKDFLLVGITGTNGKTTVSYLIKHMLDCIEMGRTGLVGTVEWIVGKHSFPAQYTTPDVITAYKLLHDMGAVGCNAAVMEVSSHGLEQNRLRDLLFDVAIFTNLSHEHLDYHNTMQQYATSKARLFSQLKERRAKFPRAILNIDSPWAPFMVEQSPQPVLSYGIEKEEAMVRAINIKLSQDELYFDLLYRGKRTPIVCPLIGWFNVYNCLAAIAFGIFIGIDLVKIAQSLRSFGQVRGRVERVPNEQGLTIFVDFAHTPEALENVLCALREIKRGRLIVVFGCGGNRDFTKRPEMGAIAERYADLSIVTSDNPRKEDPMKIIEQILEGVKEPSRMIIESDRKKAIEYAVENATFDDVVLIAGKGHEQYQILPNTTIEFCDRTVAAQFANQKCRAL